MKLRVSIFIAVLAALGLSACTTSEAEQVVQTVVVKETVVQEKEVVITNTAIPPNPYAGTLTIGIAIVPETLDPLEAPSGQSIAMTMYESLTFFNGATGEIEPLLAESWEVPDPTTYIFHLRQGAQFSNGEPFNADAVVFTYEFNQASELGNRMWSWQTVASVEKVDEYTVKITTTEPDPVFLKRMGIPHATIYPPQHAGEVGYDGLSTDPIGTGPFMFKEWVRGDKVVYEANPDYWGRPGVAGVETVVWKSIPETSSRIAALEAGEIDIALNVPPTQMGVLMDQPDLTVSRALGTGVFYVMFDNVSSGIGTPLEDARVRQALIYAIDRQAIIDAVFRGQGVVLSTLIGPLQFGNNPDLAPIPYDPAKAQELLTAAGYPNGFEISMACPSGYYANGVEACQAIIGYLDEFLDITLNVREVNLHWDLECKHEFDPMFFDSAGDSFLDPVYPVNLALITENNCWATWDSPELQVLLKAAAAIVDPDERREIYYQAADLMQTDPPAVPLWQVYKFTGLNKRVSGFTPWATNLVSLRGVQVIE
ncbi:MAG: ABC transporter substrate-binding protein [Anaerolineales bacterium]